MPIQKYIVNNAIMSQVARPPFSVTMPLNVETPVTWPRSVKRKTLNQDLLFQSRNRVSKRLLNIFTHLETVQKPFGIQTVIKFVSFIIPAYFLKVFSDIHRRCDEYHFLSRVLSGIMKISFQMRNQ